MKGKIVGVSVFLLLFLAVGVVAVGAVSQAFGSNGSDGSTGITRMAVAQYSVPPEKAEPEPENTAYRAFTYVCPFH